jgi:hypothetical protein
MRYHILFLIAILGFIAIGSGERSRTIELKTDANAPLNLGPKQIVPISAYTPFTECDISRDNCGQITSSTSSVFIADGAYNSVDMTIFFVDAAEGPGDGVFQFDPVTCSVVFGTYYSIWDFGFKRGIAFDPNRYQIWIGSFGDAYLIQHHAEPPYENISYTYVGLPIASAAIDPANDYLIVGTNSYPDMVYVFDISSGSLGSQLGSWSVPWQSTSDGFDMAGMEFDDDSGNLVMVNQYQAGPGMVREEFTFNIDTGLAGAGTCILDNTDYAWSAALIEDEDPEPFTYYFYTADIVNFSPPYDVDEYGIPVATITCSPDSTVVLPTDTLVLGLTVMNVDPVEQTPPLQVSIIAELNNGTEVQLMRPVPRLGFILHGGSSVTATFGIYVPPNIPGGFTCMLRTPLILQETGMAIDEDTCFVEVGETGLVVYDGERMSIEDWRVTQRKSEKMRDEDVSLIKLDDLVIELPY